MFADITDDITNEVDMTISEAKKKLKEVRDSSLWNYVLIGVSVISIIIAIRNASINLDEIKKLKTQIS
jgi:hypothetical protein